MKFTLHLYLVFVLLGIFDLSHQDCSNKFKRQFLARHNQLRAEHGVGHLMLDQSISQFSQQWADYLRDNEIFKHSKGSGYGENLFMSWTSDGIAPSGNLPVQSWYKEISKYPYFGKEPSMSTSAEWSHFTQLVWKETERLGVGCATKGNNFYVVANYDRPGNVIGRFGRNVPFRYRD